MITIDELVKMEKCPCDVCSSQDDEDGLLERQRIDEICDIYSNELIDYLLENPKKYLLKRKIKHGTVK